MDLMFWTSVRGERGCQGVGRAAGAEVSRMVATADKKGPSLLALSLWLRLQGPLLLQAGCAWSPSLLNLKFFCCRCGVGTPVHEALMPCTRAD